MNLSARLVLNAVTAAMVTTPLTMIGYYGVYQTVLPGLFD